ncbi:hypothetical protein SK854_14310 [Lentzea sp. BCCO 10_0061]|uniref:Uncharacterized protein n=1 Tax=Lentzea sokolovensis TaxID=3095429 RepID=A0ABU4UWY2_9PSEU|nr:hypothetical protein [Lentzea sp. BCCO 10_0061]MDX8143298.1 hypothetical protein [Lentzea sp. BCCO 10_0061]
MSGSGRVAATPAFDEWRLPQPKPAVGISIAITDRRSGDLLVLRHRDADELVYFGQRGVRRSLTERSGVAVPPDGVFNGVGDRVAVGLCARVLVERPGPDAVATVAVDADVSVVVFLEYQGKAVPFGFRLSGRVAWQGKARAVLKTHVDTALGKVLYDVADQVLRVDLADGRAGPGGIFEVAVKQVFQRFDQNHRLKPFRENGLPDGSD